MKQFIFDLQIIKSTFAAVDKKKQIMGKRNNAPLWALRVEVEDDTKGTRDTVCTPKQGGGANVTRIVRTNKGVELVTETDLGAKGVKVIEITDTRRFGQRSGLGEGRSADVAKQENEGSEQNNTQKREAKKNGNGGGGGEPPVKTDDNDLKKIRRARSIVIGIEETRNDYSDEFIRELRRIYGSARRMIEEYEMRKSLKGKNI